MGIAPLFCCFSGKSPNCIVLTGLAASFIALSFLLWGLADLWFDRDGALAIYIIAFIFICISLVGFVLLYIFLNIRKPECTRTFYSIGRIICLIIFIICIIAFVFMLTAFIILIVDYADVEKDMPGKFFPSHEWAAVFVPSIIALAALVFMILCANILYKIFGDNLLANPNPLDATQNTFVSTISNQPQPILQPVIQPPIQPVIQPPIQPVVQSVIQPPIQPVIQPPIQPVVQSVIQPPIEPVIQPTIQPVVQSVIQPPIQSSIQPTMEPVMQSVIQPTIEQSIQPTINSVIQPPIQSESAPYIGPVEEPENNGSVLPW
jgi:hypothetical protein